jgi:Mitochondrial ribosomal protein subunit
MDTWEHITEFGSASDHTLTLQKWQELGVPLTAPVAKRQSNLPTDNGSGKSVFEDDLDTVFNAKNLGLNIQEKRWKFEGPWLAGQTDGEFNQYVLKEVRGRKGEFREFLRTNFAEEKRRKQTLHEGIAEGDTSLPPVTDAELDKHVKALRRDTSEINKKIRRFFDIAPVSAPRTESEIMDWLNPTAEPNKVKTDTHTSNSPYALIGPPKTHPSAGISYTRTASKLNNHPLFGPQRAPTIVEARVVMPRQASTGNLAPVLGVGGFVTSTPSNDSSFDVVSGGQKIPGQLASTTTLVPGLLKIEPNKPGGSKVWIQPKHAHIDPKGKLQITVQKADFEAVAVREGKTDELAKVIKPAAIRGIRPLPYGSSQRSTTSSIILPAENKPSGAKGYGL